MKNKASPYLLLDATSFKDIRLTPQRHKGLMKYYWDHYSHFAHQRSLVIDSLKETLVKNCKAFTFKKWQRVISYKYSADPLSALGSIRNCIGGRFNIGAIDPTKFPHFPALYIAEDRETAYREKYGLYNPKKKYSGLTLEELTFTSKESTTIVSIQGDINQVLDLNKHNTLTGFFKLVKSIKLPKVFITRARQLNINPMFHVPSVKDLHITIMDPEWRGMGNIFGVPSNSQILGQIAHAAGIEAILYPSKMSETSNCLAIFPNNFCNSSSYIELEDDPPEYVRNSRMDSKTCANLF